MLNRSSIFIFPLIATLFAAPLPAATPAEVDTAIKKAVDSLYERQKNGNWENVPAQEGEKWDSTEGTQWGGLTGVVTYALLASDVKYSETHVAAAVSFLEKAKLRGVYAAGVRAQIWPLLPPSPAVSTGARTDAKLLMAAMHDKGEHRGMWFYYLDKPEERSDHSASQFALLGIWACEEAGVEIPDKFWQLEDTAWRAHQKPDGGWPYMSDAHDAWGDSTLSMTCAGMASLFLVQDKLNRGSIACTGNAKDAVFNKGMDFVGREFPKDGEFDRSGKLFLGGGPGRAYYLLFGLQRLGVYSGFRYFNGVDWFQSGADYLVKTQKENGGWGQTTWETAFGLLFLSRGRAPVAINKLNYSSPGANENVPWNQRPRDVSSLTTWMGKQSEHRLNWQVVDINTDPLDWMDAPVLYLSGSDALNLPKEQIDKLRTYTEAGGMIVGNADCGNMKFATSFKKLGTQIFPASEFRELPADHVIYTDGPFPKKKWKSKLGIQGLSNGARELMVLFPDADPGKAWQMQNSVSKSETFESMSDVYTYNAGFGVGRFKGDTTVVKADAAIKPTRTIHVARLEYGGNWDPEAGGWRRLAATLHNTQKIDLDIKTVELGRNQLNNTFEVAHLTGTALIKLSAGCHNELKEFVDHGGRLIIDCAGGNGEFATSVESELEQIFPDSKLAPLPDGDPAFHSPIDIAKVGYRQFARKSNGLTNSARLMAITRNGNVGVVYSPLDLSVGLVGSAVDGINGYDPATAMNLMINLLVSGSTPATQPAAK